MCSLGRLVFSLTRDIHHRLSFVCHCTFNASNINLTLFFILDWSFILEQHEALLLCPLRFLIWGLHRVFEFDFPVVLCILNSPSFDGDKLIYSATTWIFSSQQKCMERYCMPEARISLGCILISYTRLFSLVLLFVSFSHFLWKHALSTH